MNKQPDSNRRPFSHKKSTGQKLPYAKKWRVATLNCRGLNIQSKREQLMEIMKQLKIDILGLQETKVRQCSEETKTREGTNEHVRFFFNSKIEKP